MLAVFTGFDSAWGAANSGAICDLLFEGNSLRLPFDPVVASWDAAIVRAGQKLDADLHVWAVDQPLVVNNEEGCRPVDSGLASALMADFGCGAYPSNLGMPPWSKDAPIWNFIGALHDNGYVHNPMAIPSVAGGRFYLECYPHPAILGLFDLERILQYKVARKNPEDWQRLVRLVRSLTSAELPVRNICGFVQKGLPQNKRNEDKLDAIISAYVAAYWWRFGVQRSTMIGDVSTAYIVTPHSNRTLASLARVFDGRMNQRRTASALPPAQATPLERGGAQHDRQASLPRCDWVYFAGPAKASFTVTRDFVKEHHVIVRNVYNAARQRIANVQHLEPGERILLVYGGKGKPYHALLSATISAGAAPVRYTGHEFEAFSYIDESLDESLTIGGYDRDPVLGRFIGISITAVQDLRDIRSEIPRPTGNNTIWRWDEVFGR